MKTPNFDNLTDKEKDVINYYMYVKRVKVVAFINGFYPGGEEGIDYNRDSCRTESGKLFAKPCVKAAIDEKFKELWEKRFDLQGKLLDELSVLAFSDIGNVFNFSDGKITFKDLNEKDTRAIRSIKVREENRGEGEDIVKSDITTIEMHSKIKALSELTSIMGLSKLSLIHKTVDDDGKEIGFDVKKLSDEDLRKIINEQSDK